jgi:uncharacterized membrane protein
MTDDLSDNQNVIVVNFSDDANAYEGITALKQLDSQGQLDLAAAAVVARDEDGQVEIKDDVADATYGGTVGGGLVGLLIGIIGGPLGILIGGATGVLVGSLFDTRDDDDTESALSDVSTSIRAGRTALLAEVTEQSTEVVDTAMRALGGDVLRRPLNDVEAEVAAAEDAQRKAKREARRQLLEARQDKHKEEIRAKLEELKAKLHLDKKAPATTA